MRPDPGLVDDGVIVIRPDAEVQPLDAGLSTHLAEWEGNGSRILPAAVRRRTDGGPRARGCPSQDH